MIVILCDSFDDVKECFACFMDFLENNEPFSINKVFKSSYCVETDDDLRYIFVDYRFEKLFENFHNPVDIIEQNRFFEGIEEYYFGN